MATTHIAISSASTTFDLGKGVLKDQLTDAVEGHILDETELIGTFQR